MDIAGAGMAGLLAARMLPHRSPRVFELQSTLPNNHSAVLRFRSSIVGDTTGIPFRRVKMIKATLPWRNPVADAMAYSVKVTGVYSSDRSIGNGAVVTEDRFIAPPDFIQRLAARTDIVYNHSYEFRPPQDLVGWAPMISTLPMPALMKLLDYPLRDRVQFEYKSGTNIRARIPGCDAYISLMIPDPQYPFWRVSVTGDELIVEMPQGCHFDSAPAIVRTACDLLGISERGTMDLAIHNTRYAKIAPIDEGIRKDFIFWATDQHGVFSLGRFATWRPGLLLDDLVQDIRLIDQWAERSERYAVARHRL